MKKITLFLCLALLCLDAIIAQEDNMKLSNSTFGVKAGYNSFIERFSVEGESVSASGSGFYLGVFADFDISEKFGIHPEIQYVLVTHDNVDGEVLVVPLRGKYKLNDELSLLAGPQLDYILEKDTDGIKKLGIGIALGLSYDVSKHFLIDLNYSFGLNNRLEEIEEIEDFESYDFKFKINYFQVGVGYRF